MKIGLDKIKYANADTLYSEINIQSENFDLLDIKELKLTIVEQENLKNFLNMCSSFSEECEQYEII